jgi:ABC-type multidrug transport system ATPase subunit
MTDVMPHQYPLLIDLTTNELLPIPFPAPDGGREPSADGPGPGPGEAGAAVPFRIRRVGPAHVLEPAGPAPPIWVDGRRADAPMPLVHGALIGFRSSWLRFLERPDGEPCREPEPTVFAADFRPGAAAGAGDGVVDGAGPGPGTLAAAGRLEPLGLPEDRTVTLGRDPAIAELVLDHPIVSRVHALIVRRGRVATLIDQRSANGTFLDGDRVRGSAAVRAGQRIDIGPFALTFDGTRLVPVARSGRVELLAVGLTRRGTDPQGHLTTLLDDVNVAVLPGEFVAILGPSGAGKSTLLKALSGREPADVGQVLVNQQDLYEHFDAIKRDIAVVHQRDALHELLTLEAVLDYTARLRLPPDTDRSERRERVARMLDELGLTERRALPIHRLSGGQLKRASLANETLHRPNLLFLDEVTSGLDEPTDRELMRLFRQLADQGRTVVCVTHTLVNVEECCHLIVFLARDGRLAFVGSPSEARTYFGVERLGDIYELVMGRTPDPRTDGLLTPEAWQARFRSSEYHARYVDARLGSVDRTRTATRTRTRPEPPPAAPHFERIVLGLRQFPTLLGRLVALVRADLRALAMTLAQGPIVAAALFLLFHDVGGQDASPARVETTVKLGFLLAVSCLWFGVNGAAKEIVKERIIFARERHANLSVGAYYGAKLVLHSLVAVLQASILFGLVDVLCHPPWDRPATWGVLATLGAVGASIGLWISAIAESEEMAVGLAPIALIPQVILAGVIAPLSGLSLALARVGIASYWGCQGLRRLIEGPDGRLGVGDGPGLRLSGAMLAAHFVMFAVAAGIRMGSKEGERTPGSPLPRFPWPVRRPAAHAGLGPEA